MKVIPWIELIEMTYKLSSLNYCMKPYKSIFYFEKLMVVSQ